MWPALDLPEALSDQAAAELVQCLYAFAAYVETRYFEQIERYYDSEPDDAADPRQQRLWDDDPGSLLFDEPLF